MAHTSLTTWLRGAAVLAVLASVSVAQPALAIPITSVPVTISTPGTYEVPQDLTVPPGTTALHAITIAAGDVTINFNGHRLTCPTPGTTFGGISTATALSKIAIRGAQVSGFVSGIRIEGVNHSLTGNTVTSCVNGIVVIGGASNTISGNTVRYCTVAGITINDLLAGNVSDNIATGNNFGIWVVGVTSGVTVSRNQVFDSTEVGLRVTLVGGAAGNIMQTNVVARSRLLDISDNSGCLNGWRDNSFVTDNETGIAQGRLFGCIR